MSILVRFEPVDLTAAQYDDTIRMVQESDADMSGAEYHVCYGTEGNLSVIEVWSSPEQFEAFGEELMPMLEKAGIKFAKPPEISEVHNSMTP